MAFFGRLKFLAAQVNLVSPPLAELTKCFRLHCFGFVVHAGNTTQMVYTRLGNIGVAHRVLEPYWSFWFYGI